MKEGCNKKKKEESTKWEHTDSDGKKTEGKKYKIFCMANTTINREISQFCFLAVILINKGRVKVVYKLQTDLHFSFRL